MNVAVLGVESTARDLAQVCALAGYEVGLHSEDASSVMDAVDSIEHQLSTLLEDGSIEASTKANAIDNLEATTGLEAAVGDAGIVIEAATTDVESLQKRFADIEKFVNRETIISTVAGSVSITAAGAGLRYPDRAVGLHFQSPLERRFVEIIVTGQTSESTIERVESFIEDIDGTAVRVGDMPGLASTRLALSIEVEAMRLVDEGVGSVETVDTILSRGYDHPIGPLEQADRVGLDRRLESLEHLAEALGNRFSPPEVLIERVESGATGMDTGEGFYQWDGGEPGEPALSDPQLVGTDQLPDDPTRR